MAFLGVLLVFTVVCISTQYPTYHSHSSGSSRSPWIKLNRAKSQENVKIIFAIKQTNVKWLEEKAKAVSSPDSPEYGNFMNFDEISQHVQGSMESVSAVINFLQSFKINNECIHFTLGQDFVVVNTSLGIAEDLFKAEFYHYKHVAKHDLRVLRSDVYTPPASLAGHIDYVLGVSINDLPKVPLKNCVQGQNTYKSENYSNLKLDPITPFHIQQMYNLSWYVANNTRSSQSVVSFLRQYYNSKDLKMFLARFNLTGGIIDHLGYNNMSNPGLEAELDMQYIFSTGQGVSTTFVSIPRASTDGFEDFLTWIVTEVNRTASPLVHSVSYSDIEAMVDPAYRNRTEIELMKFAVSGRTILIASGDSGVLCNVTSHTFTPYWPCTSAYVTSVGGTMPNVKTVWHGSGGGFSNFFPTPDYQRKHVENYLDSGNSPDKIYFNSSGRAYPDLSAFATSCHTNLEGEYIPVDGTSCATPIVAGELNYSSSIN